ncbi:MAG TPA: NAD+ synthase, partial [Thermodesulfobacteriaceae bacterium]|nr:NAD+ synthase [Thermodesulfobacteriaceae bacterium]
RVLFRYRKALIPYYDIYEEPRYFTEGRSFEVFEFQGRRLGLTICEDLWNESGYVPNLYPVDPVKELRKAGAEILINLSSSPFHLGKGELRRKLFAEKARRSQTFIFCCNQVGAQDHLIFDGQSLVLSPKGDLLAQARDFEEDLIFTTLRPVKD